MHSSILVKLKYLEHVFTVDVSKTLKGRLKVIQSLHQQQQLNVDTQFNDMVQHSICTSISSPSLW